MADPKASRGSINYQGGRVDAAIGLLEYLFVEDPAVVPLTVVVDSRGRRRLKGLRNRTAASSGRQLIITTKENKTFQLHYTGALVDFSLHGGPKLNRSVVKSWATARGAERRL